MALSGKGRDLSAFGETFTGSQLGGATQTLQIYKSNELDSLLGVEV
jgi:hypothetical protein